MSPIADGDPVSVWPDMSGNGRDATADAATADWQPHYHENAINGYPAVLFSAAHGGNDRGFSLPGSFAPSEAHLYIVAKPLISSPFYSLGPQSTGNNPELPYTVDGTAHIYDHFGTSVRRDFPAGIDTTAGFIYHSHAKAGLWEAHVNGVLVYSTNTNTVSWGGRKLGAWLWFGSTVTMCQGYIGEFRVYDGPHANGDDDVAAITAALAANWGFTL